MRSFAGWVTLANELKEKKAPEADVTYCLARAYTCEDGFYRYCHDVLGYTDLYEPFHQPICDLVVSPRRYKLLQAARQSFKSSIGTIGYATWRIAKETIETGHCNIRILIASEVLDLAKEFTKTINNMLQEPRWKEFYGDHRGSERKSGWGSYTFTSKYRTLARTKEPTVSYMSLEAPKTGFHYDLIIADDLEAERTSASRDQIERCWSFYRLLHSLLEPVNGQLSLISTRWHYDDIYSRIIERNDTEDEHDKFKMVIRPARSKSGELTWPDRFSDEVLASLLAKQGSYIFSCQYLLDPVPPEDRTFKLEWIKYITANQIDPQRRYRVFVGADFAYTPQRNVDKGETRLADYTVILTAAVDDRWNYYLLDWYRKRCTKLEGVQELFRQYVTHKAIQIGLQKNDRLLVDDNIIHYAFNQRMFQPRREYISYPAGTSKFDRIETILQPLFEANKVFLLPNMKWMEQELLDFPRGAHDDGADALVNLVHISRPAAGIKMKKQKLTDIQRRIAFLKRGIYVPEGDERSWKTF